MSLSTCRSCGAEIVWAKTVNGKNIPVDPTPVESGNLGFLPGNPPTVEVRNYPEPFISEQPRYVSHFKTCPNAAQHRRQK